MSDILAISFKSTQINVNVKGLNHRYLFMMLSKLPICYKKHKTFFFLKMPHRTKLFLQTNVIECLILATIMLTINVHPCREDQVRQQFYWPQSYTSPQGSSTSLAFIQMLFGRGGPLTQHFLLNSHICTSTF